MEVLQHLDVERLAHLVKAAQKCGIVGPMGSWTEYFTVCHAPALHASAWVQHVMQALVARCAGQMSQPSVRGPRPTAPRGGRGGAHGG